MVLCLILSLSMTRGIFKLRYALETGDISPNDIKAPQAFPVVNRKATLEEERKAVDQVHRVYLLDLESVTITSQVIDRLIKNLQRIDLSVDLYKTEMIDFVQDDEFEKSPETKVKQVAPEWKHDGMQVKIKRFRKETNLNLSDYDLEVLFYYASPEHYLTIEKIRSILNNGFKKVLRNGVIKNKEELIEAIKPKTSVYLKKGDKIDEKLTKVSRFHSFQEAIIIMKAEITNAFVGEDKKLGVALNNFVKLLLRPNLKYDLMATKDLIEKARNSIPPVMMAIKQGQMIVREGEQVSDEQFYLLKALSSFETRSTIKVIFGRSLWVIFLIVIALFYLRKFYPEIYSDNSSLLLLGIITFTLVPITRVLLAFKVSPYFLPIAVTPILISIIFEAGLAIPAVFILVGMIYPVIIPELQLVSYALVGSVIAVINTSHLRKRDDLTKAGLLIGIANVITILIIHSYTDQEFFTRELLNHALIGLSNGLLTYFITMGMLPALEGLFKITTDIKLIELSDLNRPILRKMALEAPGTYHHSIIVGNLAEAAADGIKANPLLVRVASYYHDIGKIDKSEYFSENNKDNSKHETLSPNMSSLILTSHVKEGVELGKKQKLPDSILDIIRQHHGSTMVSFFYQKALKEDEHKTIKRDDFRYPGPKPKTREAAIIMLADSVEATSRSLSKVSSPTIRNMIRKTIRTKLEDKQLDDCDLTLKDLRVIAATFERILSAIFHTRIEYPEEKESEEKRHWGKREEGRRKEVIREKDGRWGEERGKNRR